MRHLQEQSKRYAPNSFFMTTWLSRARGEAIIFLLKEIKYNQEQVSIHMLTFNREHLCNPEFTISSHKEIFQHSNQIQEEKREELRYLSSWSLDKERVLGLGTDEGKKEK